MGFRLARPLVAVLAVSSVAALAFVAADWSRANALTESRAAPTHERTLAARISTLEPRRLARSAVDWRGGTITASTGEAVRVFVSQAFPLEAVTPEGWAEFLVKLAHGPELGSLTMYIAPLDEIQELCGGSQALGCYSRDRGISIGETVRDGTTPEEVVRHEYGHHVALYRSNAPWPAIDWGPKRWASSASVCARVARQEAFPGNERERYAQNPGEAWAEAYRLMDERRAGIATGRWEIVSSSFFPTDADVQAAERDVLEPWTAGRRVELRRVLKRGQVWWIPVATPLDGAIAATVTIPRGGRHEAVLLAANRRTLIKRAAAAGPRTRRIRGTICGQRSTFLRVTQRGAPGLVTAAVAIP
jgi:hypothetical protein